jgi:hypothetical protein
LWQVNIAITVAYKEQLISNALKSGIDQLKTHFVFSPSINRPSLLMLDDQQNRRIERTILYAKFRYNTAIEDVHYHADRSIDRNQICAWRTVRLFTASRTC